MTNEEKIKEFIKANKLAFTIGRRNSDSTILAGYALHLGYDSSDRYELLKIIKSVCKGTKPEEEFNRVLYYAEENNYDRYWSTKAAKTKYIF